MKFLTVKRVFSLLVLVAIGVVLGLYFLTGMKVVAVNLDNVEFLEEEFVDYTSAGQKVANPVYYRIDEKGQRILDDNKNPIAVQFKQNVIIGQSDKYILLFDEETTNAKIVKRLPGDGPTTDFSNRKPVFQTAGDDGTSPNLVVRYAEKASGKIPANGLDTINFSTKFENALTGQYEKHYKLRYLTNSNGQVDGVQVLYEIGKFSANLDYFPVAFEQANYTPAETEEEQAARDLINRNSLEERFRGNTIFSYKDDLETVDGEKRYVRSYTGKGFTYSEAAAKYIEENGLAIVTEGLGYWELDAISPELLYDGFGVHINTEDSPVTMNPFIPNDVFFKIKSTYGNGVVEVDFTDHKVYTLQVKTSVALSLLYSYLYEEKQFYDISSNKIPIYDEFGNPIVIGGFHARDGEGNFVYDEDGKPVRELYSLALVAEDNAVYGVETATSLERFQVGLQLKLTNEGFVATVMGDSLRDSDFSKTKGDKFDHGYLMYALEVLPRMTSVHNYSILDPITGVNTPVNVSGMMVIPDGSGAIINFNNNKAIQNYSPYSANVYGFDRGFIQKIEPEQTETLMFGMYGFIDLTHSRGLMNVIEKGAAQSNLKADTPRGSSIDNYIYYTTTVRQNELVAAGTGWYTSEFMKWAKNLSTSDLQYNYIFLEDSDLSYVGLANKYRNYLINRYNLEEKDNTYDNVVDVNFLGAFERYSLLLGIKYMTADSLTTFKQAESIVQELLDNNIKHMSVSYTSWTNKELEYETTSRLKVSRVLGNAKAMKNLNTYLNNKGISFYPEMFVASSKGYDYAFGKMKYTAKSVGNFYASQYPFNLATMMPDKTLSPTHYINPGYYSQITDNLLKSYSKLNINGANVVDLGNLRLGTYGKDKEIYPYEATLQQIEALKNIKETVGKVKISAPFDYAFPYVDIAIGVPMTSSAYGIFDKTIPFYQLVVSGLFDYTTETVNGLTDNNVEWFFIKALETGSNLQFVISYEDPKILLDTDYTQYYKSYYQNWKGNIIDLNNRINTAGIHKGQLVNHESITKDVSKVTYETKNHEKIELVINSGTTSYNYGGQNINPYSYIKLGGE